MTQILDLLGQHLSGDTLSALSKRIGASEEQTQQAVGAALPTLLGAIAQQTRSADGQANLHQALLKDHSGALLDNLSAFFNGDATKDAESGISDRTVSGGAILDHILGGRRERVESGVSQASGLSASQSMNLMAMLAPVLMGALGRRRKDQDLSSGGLSDLLQREKAEVEEPSGGLLARMFDQDGDGDFDFMDIMKFGAKKIFGR